MRKTALVFLLALAAHAALAADVDTRQKLVLDQAQRGLVLTEMHTMFAATQGIIAALSQDDMTAVAKYAHSIGMVMGREAGGHLHHALPAEFKQLGMSVHQDFDMIAMDAESYKDPKHTLQQLGDTMNKCIACHTVYQISNLK